MSKVDINIVTQFIMKNALHGPENVSNDGQFIENLLEPAEVVSDISDSNLCVNFINNMK